MIGLPEAVRRLFERVTGSGSGGTRDAIEVPARPRETRAKLDCTPEECICTLLRHDGGWLWQQEVVEQTGWSASTVSRLLSEMEGDGSIDRERFGRSKAVGLPGVFTGEST